MPASKGRAPRAFDDECHVAPGSSRCWGRRLGGPWGASKAQDRTLREASERGVTTGASRSDRTDTVQIKVITKLNNACEPDDHPPKPIPPRKTLSRTAGLWIAVLALQAVGPTPAWGAQVEGVRFAREFRAGDQDLELRGAALLRWRALFKAYVAALYLPPSTPSSDALEDVPKRLEIEYFWAIGRADFGRAADRLLEDALGPEALDDLRDRLDELHARYEAVQPGDRYALTYQPGVGTELSKNGRSLAVIPGADFAAAYFSMWLGERPIDARFRDRLLEPMNPTPTRARE